MIAIDLHGRIALVTGASGGLGQAIAQNLAHAGATVAAHYHNGRPDAEALIARITQGGGRGQSFAADISDTESAAALIASVETALGGIDILINNAGADGTRATVGHDDTRAWEKVIGIDLLGPYYCARAVVGGMKERGRGVIINITSVHEFIPWSGYSAYTAAKAGLSMFTKTLAQETAASGIRVLAVAPGAIQTAINKEVWSQPQSLADLDQKIAMARLGQPTEIGQVIAFLASDLASYMTGTTIAVDGGMLIYPGFREGG